MLIGSAVCQTPAIFGMVIAFMLMFIDFAGRPLHPTLAGLLGAGLSVGLACIGPGIGNGLTAREANIGIARCPESYGQVTTTMLVGMSVAQSTAIYGFLIALILVFRTFEPSTTFAASAALLGAGLAMGFGGIGPGVGEGLTAAYAAKWVARNTGNAVLLTRTMLVGQAVAESTGIYSLIVALLLTLTL
jgi:ATP synthase F0 subunit c